MSLLNELKRRNVFKVTTAYLALGWVVLEGSGTVASVLRLPDWTSSFLFWLGLAGLPFVVVFAWVFELTPEGLQRTSEVAPGQSITGVTSKRLDYAIVVLLVLAIGMAALQYFRPPIAPPVATSDATVTPSAPAAEVATPVPSVPALEPAAVTPNDKSIAVLPFVNMSSDKDQEYFSDGMAEELLNLLAQAPDLKVIARTSSFAFKGKDVPIAEIARQLNVAHVLEGSVRKAGNTVRITAQLIRAADSVHLWSETYDRPLDDVFAVQDEIANAIVQALQIKLAGGTLSRREGGTQNLEAYQLLLRSRSANMENTRSSLEAAAIYLEQAIKVDPAYGMAWTALSENFSNRADSGFIDPIEGYERARQLVQRAVQLSPDSAYAHARLQYVHLNFDWDWAAAESDGRRARAIDPTDLEVLNVGGILSIVLGRWDDAQKNHKEMLLRDPLGTYGYFNLGYAYYGAGRFVDAEQVLRRLLEVESGFAWASNYLGLALLAQGRADEALAVVQQQANERERQKILPVFLYAAGRRAEADEAQKAQTASWGNNGAFYIAATHAYRGDRDGSIEWLERAYAQKDGWLSWILGERLFKGMADDPRFIAFLKKMNLPTDPVPVNWQ